MFYPEWDAAADVTVAILRTEAGRDPRDKQLHDLIGELSTCSDEFRTRWGTHDVRRHGSGTKRFHHHDVGDLVLTYEGMEVTAEPGPSILIATAEVGSESQERLDLLASWASTAQSPGVMTPATGAAVDAATPEDAERHGGDASRGPRR